MAEESGCGRLKEYGGRSTLHGISQLHNSHDKCRRTFWIITTICATSMCFYHVNLSILNFKNTPIASSYFRDHSEAIFPDATFCNLKPVAESVLRIYKHVLYQHWEEKWDFFRYWNETERKRQKNESNRDYMVRIKQLFRRYMEIFWASGDTRDFGMFDKTFLHDCEYNGNKCSEKDFKLVQDSKFWNCYTFKPKTPESRMVTGNGVFSGLHIIMYSDSFTDTDTPDVIKYIRNRFSKQEEEEPYNLEDFLQSGRTVNEVITGLDFLSSGIRVFIHDQNNFPSLSTLFFDIPNGAHSTIKFSQINYDAIDVPQSPCMMESTQNVSYVRYFGVNSTNVGRMTFAKTDLEAMVDLKQAEIYKDCGCYSHRFPFKYNTSVLCYFAPQKHWKHPPDYLLKQIDCHDKVYKEVEVMSNKFFTEANTYHPCQNRHYQAFRTDTNWPKDDDMYAFVNQYIIPNLHDGQELGKDDTHPHHLLKNIIDKPDFQTREQTILTSLLDQKCANDSYLKNRTFVDFWCTDIERIRKNHIKISIQPEFTHASAYLVESTYKWPEVLSEIGGTMGLWMGMSLLTIIELIEVALCCCLKPPDTRKKRAEIINLKKQKKKDKKMAKQQADNDRVLSGIESC